MSDTRPSPFPGYLVVHASTSSVVNVPGDKQVPPAGEHLGNSLGRAVRGRASRPTWLRITSHSPASSVPKKQKEEKQKGAKGGGGARKISAGGDPRRWLMGRVQAQNGERRSAQGPKQAVRRGSRRPVCMPRHQSACQSAADSSHGRSGVLTDQFVTHPARQAMRGIARGVSVLCARVWVAFEAR